MPSPDRHGRPRRPAARAASPARAERAGWVYAALLALPFAVAALAPPLPATPPAVMLKLPALPQPRPAAAADPPVASASTPPAAPPAVVPTSVAGLDRLFASLGYDFDAVRDSARPVPRVMLSSLPPDIDAVGPVEARKDIFFRAALPLVLQVNEAILADRAELLRLAAGVEEGRELAASERLFLSDLAQRYRLAWSGDDPDFAELARRVDAIPPALALAQGAEESGWGTSRLAREANALFGESRWSPERRTWYVKPFETLPASVAAYAHNLNTHPAYAAFRAQRADMRAAGRIPDGESLAGTLLHYSERRAAYIASLKRIIRANDLGALDGARLHPPPTQPEPSPRRRVKELAYN